MIHLLGFQTSHNITFLIFFLFLMIYCVTICGNLLIITLVSYSKTLHSPMYFFLSQLSVSDSLLANDILPIMLHAIFMKETILSFSDCVSQFYFFCVSEASECLLLTVMCYDRYLAICEPLHYTLAMNFRVCCFMITTCWAFSFLIVFIPTIRISHLEFCGPNIVDHFFCDLDPILQLSCSDTTIVLLEVTTMNFIFVLIPSRGQSWNISKYLSLLYTVVTPLMNPIIYSLRNKDLKKATAKIINQFLHLYYSK
uniref:Olfactory receptor n=1 Tax=Pyxicephalus adspersus TaxID=30357 RepID=A0AAV3APM3_PYXAD|nr:TPA: hypothetical protein GDO54_005845 [Pyxicephalus adspersus]